MWNVLIADDHAIFRQGLVSVLKSISDLRIVGQAANWIETLHLVQQLEPDLLVTDLSMPGPGFRAVMARLAELPSAPKVIFLTQHAEPELARQVLSAGAVGYVLKENAVEELFHAVAAVRRGHTYVNRNVAKEVDVLQSRHASLSPREIEIVRYVAKGFVNKQIAQNLGCAVKTVDTHRQRIMKKLNVHSAVELVQAARQSGWIE